MDLDDLVEISRFYGKDPDFVLGGGGNTSYKEGRYIYVKASGYNLASIDKDGFAKLKRDVLEKIWEKKYPSDKELREKQALEDLMASRDEGEEKRPSVESLLHSLLPQKYIVHTHPALINGLTCSKDGRRIADKLFGNRCMWVGYVDPGYVLAKEIKRRLEEHEKRYNLSPDIIFLENHGIFTGAESIEEIKNIYRYVADVLNNNIDRKPDFSSVDTDKEEKEKVIELLKKYPGFKDFYITFENNMEISTVIRDRDSFEKVHYAFSPDHVLFSGPEMLFVEDPENLKMDIDKYRERNNCYPRIIAVKKTGIFAVGEKEDISKKAMEFFLNSLKIAVYAESFGGYKFMDKEQVDFIMNWEVEKYRSKVSFDK